MYKLKYTCISLVDDYLRQNEDHKTLHTEKGIDTLEMVRGLVPKKKDLLEHLYNVKINIKNLDNWVSSSKIIYHTFTDRNTTRSYKNFYI